LVQWKGRLERKGKKKRRPFDVCFVGWKGKGLMVKGRKEKTLTEGQEMGEGSLGDPRRKRERKGRMCEGGDL